MHANYGRLVAAVRGCRGNATEAKRIHQQIAQLGLDSSKFLGNLLVDMYGKCGRVEEAYQVFERITTPNVYSWNMIITAFAQNGGNEQRAIGQFWRMQLQGVRADRITWLVLLNACATSGSSASLRTGMHLHSCIEEAAEAEDPGGDVCVRNALLHMYGKCGFLSRANEIFHATPRRDVVTWSSMVAAFSQNGRYTQALKLLEVMDMEGAKPSYVTYISFLEACVGVRALERGRLMHRRIREAGLDGVVNLGNAVLSMYARFGLVDAAVGVFDEMKRNVVSWNAMMTAYALNGQGSQAVNLLQGMDLEGLRASRVAFLSLLEACPSQTYASFLHLRVAAAGFEYSEVVMTNALMNMHAKCGDVNRSRRLFETMPARDVCSWSTMIDAYAQRGHHREALDLFTGMVLEGLTPTEITFISVLCACSHGGLAELGWGYFNSMVCDFGISPTQEHLGCLVDMFGRVGWLDAANAFASSAFQDNPVAWIILLAACKTHGDLRLGEGAAQLAMKLDPQTQTSYLLLSNMFTPG